MFRNKIFFIANALLTLWLFQSAEAAGHDGTEPIRVGILHSLSGTMAGSETPLKDVMLMLIAEQNSKGGLLGRRLEPVVADPASSLRLFTQKTRELLVREHVAVVFGCWTTASRKAVLPVLEEYNGLLFYPVQYEGEESSRNIIDTGGTPIQQAIPAVQYLLGSMGVERFVMVGTDYPYSRTINKIITGYLRQHGVGEQDMRVQYHEFGFEDWQEDVADIRSFASQGKKTAIISTVNGDSNASLYRELAAQNIQASDLPVMAFSFNEQELSDMDARSMRGHLATWNYFMNISHPDNKRFISNFRAFMRDGARVVSDPMEAHYIGFNLWVKAVEKAGTTDVNRVLDNILNLEVPNLTGGTARVLSSHNITKPAMIGEIGADGQFHVIWESSHEIAGEAWSDYLDSSRGYEANWSRSINCGRYNLLQNKCI